MAKKSQASKRKSVTDIIQPIHIPEWLILHNVPGKKRPQDHSSPTKDRGGQNRPDRRKRPSH